MVWKQLQLLATKEVVGINSLHVYVRQLFRACTTDNYGLFIIYFCFKLPSELIPLEKNNE